MPYAITLRLDAKAASCVVAMWEELAARGVSDDAIRLGYPPHLTLAVLPDGTDESRLLTTTRQIAARWQALLVSFASIGLFPGERATLFLAPVVTPELLGRHAALLSSLACEIVDSYYRAGHWVPHVTLASDLAYPIAAVAMPGPLRLPIAAVLNTLEVLRFRPVQVLASYRLVPP
jgi:2'-5' RNA ligase